MTGILLSLCSDIKSTIFFPENILIFHGTAHEVGWLFLFLLCIFCFVLFFGAVLDILLSLSTLSCHENNCRSKKTPTEDMLPLLDQNIFLISKMSPFRMNKKMLHVVPTSKISHLVHLESELDKCLGCCLLRLGFLVTYFRLTWRCCVCVCCCVI